MNEVRLSQRTVTFIETTDTKLSWQEANEKAKKIGWRIWLWWLPLVLLFVRWQTVLAPVGTPCAITTGGENARPIYLYKLFTGKVYYLGPESAPEY